MMTTKSEENKTATAVVPPIKGANEKAITGNGEQTSIPDAKELTPYEKGVITRAKNLAKKQAAELADAKVSVKGNTGPDAYVTTKGGKPLFWLRQVRLMGKTITGPVKKVDMANFEEVCAKVHNFDLDDWVVKEDWRARVFKNYEKIRNKEIEDIELGLI